MKYIPGLTGQMSGSMGSITASHNRFGSYLRQRVTGVNPSSGLQQLVRNIFLTLADNWVNQLSAGQRAQWNLYAANVSMKDKMGKSQFITGMNHYIRSNSVAIRGSFPRVDPAPFIFSLAGGDPTISSVLSEATQTIVFTFDDTLAWCSEDEAGMQILMTRPQSPSRSFVEPQYRWAGMAPGDNAVPITSPQNVVCPWTVAAGQIYKLEARIIRADARLSAPFHCQAYAVA